MVDINHNFGFVSNQLPPTRAKSPKLGRRKSFSDTANRVKGTYARGNRHSTGSYKEETTIAGDINTKDNSNFHNVNNGNAVRNFNNETQQLAETNNVIPAMDIPVRS